MKYILIFGIFLCILFGGIVLWMRNPLLPHPTEKLATTPAPTCQPLTVITPKSGEKITSPLSISVIVDNTACSSSHWTVWEAQAGTVTLEDNNGKVLGRAVLKTQDDWTLQKPTPYNAVIQYSARPDSGNLKLIIQEENPSGKPNPKSITVQLGN